MKAVVRHSYKGKEVEKIIFPHFTWPLTKGKQKQGNGLLLLHIPELEWLADPTHHTKVAAK
eukprot:12895374-Ditylum_brightwellii.AAC.1